VLRLKVRQICDLALKKNNTKYANLACSKLEVLSFDSTAKRIANRWQQLKKSQ